MVEIRADWNANFKKGDCEIEDIAITSFSAVDSCKSLTWHMLEEYFALPMECIFVLLVLRLLGF